MPNGRPTNMSSVSISSEVKTIASQISVLNGAHQELLLKVRNSSIGIGEKYDAISDLYENDRKGFSKLMKSKDFTELTGIPTSTAYRHWNCFKQYGGLIPAGFNGKVREVVGRAINLGPNNPNVTRDLVKQVMENEEVAELVDKMNTEEGYKENKKALLTLVRSTASEFGIDQKVPRELTDKQRLVKAFDAFLEPEKDDDEIPGLWDELSTIVEGYFAKNGEKHGFTCSVRRPATAQVA